MKFRNFINKILGISFVSKVFTIDTHNNKLYINSTLYDISILKKVYYGFSDDGKDVYIRLVLRNKNFDFLGKSIYKISDIDSFVETLQKNSVNILPTLGKEIYLLKGYAFTVSFYCQLNNKYMLTLHQYDDKKIKNFFNVETLKPLSDSKELINYDKKVSTSIIILGPEVTLGRGYGVYPIINGEILIDEIFYSFDQKKIIDKMKELFERHN